MNSNQISDVREHATQAIIGYYRGLVEKTNMTLEEIKNFPAGRDFISEQVAKVSSLVGKPQTAMLGFALSGYVNEKDMCYTVVCLIGDAENTNSIVNKVRNIVATLEESHARRN